MTSFFKNIIVSFEKDNKRYTGNLIAFSTVQRKAVIPPTARPYSNDLKYDSQEGIVIVGNKFESIPLNDLTIERKQ